jgi:hypothetical protein
MSEFSKCNLTLVCHQSWDDLRETESADVRYCDNCEKGVFSVRTRAQLEMASAVGRCVALTKENEIVGWIGQSDFDWMAEQSEVVAVRAQYPLNAAMWSRFHMAFPKVVGAEEESSPGTWITIGTFSPQVAANMEREIRVHFPELEIQERQV